MPSLIPDYEYDIFISYRHNDNRTGWVTEFVKNLEEELSATIKEPVSVYFDINPHDGLLETHNVDKSLEGKLKCLVFIPILSQTYCDPKSFAWEHEFVAFNKMANEDQFGRDVKLSNGNVASRLLPVQIHDLDPEDKAIIETEIGGVLRPVEFIFNSSGVNRPLTVSDNPDKNFNKTFYRDQVNKVANAIKQILQSVKGKTVVKGQIPQTSNASALPSSKIIFNRRRRLIAYVGLALLIISVSLFLILNTFRNDLFSASIDRSIAVLPFVNIGNDPEQEYFSDGISEEILNVLAKVSELKVIGRTSSFYFKGRNEDLRIIGEKLGVGHLLEGSVRKDGNTVRITTQLIRTTDGSHVWSETYERKMENVFQLQDEIASKVLDQLRLKLLGSITPSPRRNTEVQKLLLQGRYAFNKANFYEALDFYEKAVALDSMDAYIWTSLAQAHALLGNSNFDQFERRLRLVKLCVKKALSLDANLSDAHRIDAAALFFYDFMWEGARRKYNKAIELDSNNSDAYRNLAQVEGTLGEFEIAKKHLNKSIELNPLSYLNLSNLAGIHIVKGEYEEAEIVLSKASQISPDLAKPHLIYLYILSGKLDKAEELIRALPVTFHKADMGIMHAMILFKRGEKAEAVQLLKRSIQPERTGSFIVGRAFAFVGQKDEAFAWLDKAYGERFAMIGLKSSPFLAGIRDDPRYIALLKKMNLPIK